VKQSTRGVKKLCFHVVLALLLEKDVPPQRPVVAMASDGRAQAVLKMVKS
jgi:hypothetical protein